MDVINVLNLLFNFYRTHCDEFDETSEENKLVYTEIYQLYTNSVEDYIKTELEKRISNKMSISPLIFMIQLFQTEYLETVFCPVSLLIYIWGLVEQSQLQHKD